MKKLLLIEDERNMSRFLELELRHEPFAVTIASEGYAGLHIALSEEWDIILLDPMLPGLDGLEICRRVRSVKNTPIIMLSGRDKVSGLDCGADDYLPKPFAIDELLDRMRMLFRRQEEKPGYRLPVLAFQDLSLDPGGFGSSTNAGPSFSKR